jgi:hypothetical protein
MSKPEVIGKREIVKALVDEGFSKDEAGRAYETILDVIGAGLRAGRVLYLRKILKIWTVRRPPRPRWDPFHHRYIYNGETLALRVKSFFLNRKNPLTPRKIRGGPRSITEDGNASVAKGKVEN